MRSRIRFIATVWAVLLLAAVGCGGDGGGSSGIDLSDETFDVRTSSSEVEVEARDNAFVPPYVEVRRGTTVTFVNGGRNPHNVLPVDDEAFAPIEADELQPGDSGSVTFDEVGDFAYYCSLHGTPTKGMVGAIRVSP